LVALGGRDPEVRWSRAWDGKWRLAVFDIPNTENSNRKRMRRYLRTKNFGCLQDSVWISPDTLEEERAVLMEGKIDVESLILFEAQPGTGESDAEIVEGAWDFADINRRYSEYLRILEGAAIGGKRFKGSRQAWLSWATAEHGAWMEAVASDPLLPVRLLPPGYLGKKAWQRRLEVLEEAAQKIRNLTA